MTDGRFMKACALTSSGRSRADLKHPSDLASRLVMQLRGGFFISSCRLVWGGYPGGASRTLGTTPRKVKNLIVQRMAEGSVMPGESRELTEEPQAAWLYGSARRHCDKSELQPTGCLRERGLHPGYALPQRLLQSCQQLSPHQHLG